MVCSSGGPRPRLSEDCQKTINEILGRAADSPITGEDVRAVAELARLVTTLGLMTSAAATTPARKPKKQAPAPKEPEKVEVPEAIFDDIPPNLPPPVGTVKAGAGNLPLFS